MYFPAVRFPEAIVLTTMTCTTRDKPLRNSRNTGTNAALARPTRRCKQSTLKSRGQLDHDLSVLADSMGCKLRVSFPGSSRYFYLMVSPYHPTKKEEVSLTFGHWT